MKGQDRRRDDGPRAGSELRRRQPNIDVLILSQFWEVEYIMRLISERADGAGYLLKERVGDVQTSVGALTRVAAGGSVLDAEVVARMLGRPNNRDPVRLSTSHERATLAAMAEGTSNLGTAQAPFIGQAAVERHVTAFFCKLAITPAETGHRRVQAVLTYLRNNQTPR